MSSYRGSVGFTNYYAKPKKVLHINTNSSSPQEKAFFSLTL